MPTDMSAFAKVTFTFRKFEFCLVDNKKRKRFLQEL